MTSHNPPDFKDIKMEIKNQKTSAKSLSQIYILVCRAFRCLPQEKISTQTPQLWKSMSMEYKDLKPKRLDQTLMQWALKLIRHTTGAQLVKWTIRNLTYSMRKIRSVSKRSSKSTFIAILRSWQQSKSCRNSKRPLILKKNSRIQASTIQPTVGALSSQVSSWIHSWSNKICAQM